MQSRTSGAGISTAKSTSMRVSRLAVVIVTLSSGKRPSTYQECSIILRNMAETIVIDREAVKAHALVHGVRDAARAFGLSEDRVRQWSYREGWLKDAGKTIEVQPLPKSMESRVVTTVTKPSEAARRSLLGERSRMRAARVGDSILRNISKTKGDDQVAMSQPFAQTVGALAKVHGWGSESAGSAPLIAIQLNGYVPAPSGMDSASAHGPA